MTIDLHLDTLWKMTKYGSFQIAEGESYSDVNAANLTAGGLQAGVFALYLAQHLECDAERLIAEQITNFQSQHWPKGFQAYLAMENGALLEGKVSNLDKYAKAGIVYLTLTHNYDNELGCSATDKSQESLTPFGKDVIERCNQLGVFVDVSHASDSTAHKAIAESSKPVIASHSGCRKLFNHPRNITDNLISQIAATGGLIGVSFVRKFIGYRDAIADHIDHIVQLVGIKHAAIGSDIDGAVMCDGVDMSRWMQAFIEGLIRRGYGNNDINAIAGGNFQRLLASRLSS